MVDNGDSKYQDLRYMTGAINTMARSDDLDLCYTVHCRERKELRNITNSDILHMLKSGTITECQEKVKNRMNRKIYKYKMTGPYLGDERSNREISIIILVEVDRIKEPAIKIQTIVTTMWDKTVR